MATQPLHRKSIGNVGRPNLGRSPSERRGIAGASPGARLSERPTLNEDAVADRKIRSLVEERLAKFGPLVTDQVEVSVKNSRVLLSGEVGSTYERQAILHDVGRLAYIKHLRSNLRIEGEGDFSETASVWDRIRQQKLGFSASVAGVAVALWWLWTLN